MAKDDIVSTKRRFLKTLALAPVGASIAGRTLVDSLGKQELGSILCSSTPPMPGQGFDDVAQWKASAQWAKERILSLKEDGAAKQTFMPLLTAAHRVDALRSVSPVIRLQMAEREATRLAHAREIGLAESALAYAKKKLGFFKVFID